MIDPSVSVAGLAHVWLDNLPAMWLMLLILLVVDSRQVINVPWILLATACGATSLRGWVSSSGGWDQVIVWSTSSIAAVIACGLGLRAWLATSPRQRYQESLPLFRPGPKQPSGTLGSVGKKVSGTFRAKHPKGEFLAKGTGHLFPAHYLARPESGSARRYRTLAMVSAVVGLASSGFGLLASLHAPSAATLEDGGWASVHFFAVAMGLANVTVCSLELTFLAAPDRVTSAISTGVNWQVLTGIALLVLLVEYGLCGLLLFSDFGSDAAAIAIRILAMGFAFSLMVAHFVAWMVPYRLYRSQKSGRVSGWTSLTIAAWSAVLSLLVVSALPFAWPWKYL